MVYVIFQASIENCVLVFSDHEKNFILVSPGTDGLPASVVQTIMVKEKGTWF